MKIRPFEILSILYKKLTYMLEVEAKYEQLRKKGQNIQLGRDINIVSGTEQIKIGNFVHFMGRDYVDSGNGSISIGDNTSFNIGVILDASFQGEIIIGNDVMVGPNVVIVASSHIHDRIDIPMRDQGHIGGRIVIEDDVWIGANSVITAGAIIGHGAIIGAGAVVTHDIAPMTFAAGIPAKSISDRKNN
jgi:galactoside O-acetyltransferase